MYVQILTAATATNSPPSGATAGFSLSTAQGAGQQGLRRADSAVFLLKSTAGSGVMTVTIRLWGYSSLSAAWHVLGTGAAATRGVLNNGAAIDEITADNLAHSERIQGLSAFERIYAEITAIGGTSTAVSAWLEAYDSGQHLAA